MDIKSSGPTNKIGQTRYFYLDLANRAFSMNSYEGFAQCEGHLSSFESTLEPGSEAKKELLRYREQSNTEKAETVREWEQWREGLDYWRQYDVQPKRDSIEVMYLDKLRDKCWDISKRYGLFND